MRVYGAMKFLDLSSASGRNDARFEDDKWKIGIDEGISGAFCGGNIEGCMWIVIPSLARDSPENSLICVF